MKLKHLEARIAQARALAKCSTCSRRQIGAVLLDPERNVVLADGYNGPPRGQPESKGDQCGGPICLRNGITSGTMLEVGCHHAEANVLMNAAANGTRTAGAWLIVTAEPCLMCAKLLHHAGVLKVLLCVGGYTTREGVNYLLDHSVAVEFA